MKAIRLLLPAILPLAAGCVGCAAHEAPAVTCLSADGQWSAACCDEEKSFGLRRLEFVDRSIVVRWRPLIEPMAVRETRIKRQSWWRLTSADPAPPPPPTACSITRDDQLIVIRAGDESWGVLIQTGEVMGLSP
ncbi:MAG: hypothetical protein BIFFINMI_02578 [Phycisphaerae bacterium]|nr:hypothetical protein [Phycisphaerae bacterium]